jgi:hypothetical protein
MAGRRQGIQHLFNAVENKFGDLSRLLEPKSVAPVITSALAREHLAALFAHEIAAVHVRGFYPAAAASALAARLTAASDLHNWKISTGKNL